MSDLLGLAARVEALGGADRALDIEIAVAVDWHWKDWEEGEPTIRAQAHRHGLDWVVQRVFSGASIWRNAPAYTASLDAAMTLLDGHEWCLSVDRVEGAFVTIPSSERLRDAVHASAATPALALTAAALRARSTPPAISDERGL